MQISPDTEAVVEYLQAYSGGRLRKAQDIGLLLEVGARQGVPEIANKLIFTGAALWHVYRVWKRLEPSAEGYQGLVEAFSGNVTEMRVLLQRLLEMAPQEVQERFQETYLRVAQGAVRNLVDLAHDLSWLKRLQNEARHRKGDLPAGEL
ncbi:MAG: hypothetical protein NZ473_03560 [Candidatus Kapabacteria bacterium]|nr:hypothetical protein [Candidatus Kapabacteria bacterium]MCS7169047.1 hypothetical protein [Candidatus Kapabacteria bacterium]MDW7997768.1 hypothetical protein [Bacteroidota bacterium]MDW8224724.1 hypothetical protein [Bacteroidota bacterium]